MEGPERPGTSAGSRPRTAVGYNPSCAHGEREQTMSEPRPVLLWSAVALAAVACEPQPPRGRPAAADREVIASRLVDALAGAAVTVGDFERSTAPREEDLLDWREGAQLGAPWVALDGGGRAPRGSATDSGRGMVDACARARGRYDSASPFFRGGHPCTA